MITKPRLGRPPARGERMSAELPRVRVTPAELEHYRTAAAERGESVSEVIRRALRRRYGEPK